MVEAAAEEDAAVNLTAEDRSRRVDRDRRCSVAAASSSSSLARSETPWLLRLSSSPFYCSSDTQSPEEAESY